VALGLPGTPGSGGNGLTTDAEVGLFAISEAAQSTRKQKFCGFCYDPKILSIC
jgi:hypothetical protein